MQTIHSLIKTMEARAPALAGLSLMTKVSDAPLFGQLSNLAQDLTRLHAIADTFEMLVAQNNAQKTDIEKLAKELLTTRSFYGSVCEVASYGWLQRAKVKFHVQVPRSGTEVLNPNGTEVDGTILFSILTSISKRSD